MKFQTINFNFNFENSIISKMSGEVKITLKDETKLKLLR